MELKTIAGKIIDVKNACLYVSFNSLIACGHFYELHIVAKLPRSRKYGKLTFLIYKDRIAVNSLHHHGTYYDVSVQELKEFIKQLEVKTHSFDKETVLSPELKQETRNYILNLYCKDA